MRKPSRKKKLKLAAEVVSRVAELLPIECTDGVCVVCKCTYDNACHDDELGPCWWVRYSLCSHCVRQLVTDALTELAR